MTESATQPGIPGDLTPGEFVGFVPGFYERGKWWQFQASEDFYGCREAVRQAEFAPGSRSEVLGVVRLNGTPPERTVAVEPRGPWADLADFENAIVTVERYLNGEYSHTTDMLRSVLESRRQERRMAKDIGGRIAEARGMGLDERGRIELGQAAWKIVNDVQGESP